MKGAHRGGAGGERAALAEPLLERRQAGERPLAQLQPPRRLVAEADRQLRKQPEGDVRRLVLLGVTARDVAAERAERGVLGERRRLLAAQPYEGREAGDEPRSCRLDVALDA
jgi:hypothetical protein